MSLLPHPLAPALTPLRGVVRVPGDKSISHRALLLGGLATGTTRIRGLLEGEDVRSTWGCLAALGVPISRAPDPGGGGEVVVVEGRPWRTPAAPLDCGNSGTTMRLLLGALAGRPGVEATLVGDASLSRRPMERVAAPLRRMGAMVETTGGTAPVRVRGAALTGIDFESPVASAQVKSAVLLAGLAARGTTRVREPGRSRDHTERALRARGVRLDEAPDGALALEGGQALRALDVDVPGDPSSAAFLLAAALLVPGSHVSVEGVGLNPTRTGALEALRAMGARLEVAPGPCPDGGEPVGSVSAAPAAPLVAADLGGEVVLRAIDEVPVLAVVAAFARGRTRLTDAGELRHKESDRLAAVARGLGALGVEVTERPDGLEVGGDPDRALRGGVTLATHGDHRLAMAFAVAALRADGPVFLDDGACVAVSYPGFWGDLRRLGGGA